MERSGRGGKAVTVVEQLGVPPESLAAWLKDLKHALGCGGSVEGDALVIQGDQRPRVRAWLSERGVRRVTMG
jgi:translation initiation factor 1